MRPLTIDELRALKAGEWLWVCGTRYGNQYAHICLQNFEENYINLTLTFGSNERFSYSTYGETWLAYKNKEQAESKGEIVELPCNVGDTVYWVSCFGQLKVKEFTAVSIDAKTIDGELCWYAWGKNGQGGRCVDNGNSGWYLGLNKARAEEVLRFVKGDDNKWTIK